MSTSRTVFMRLRETGPLRILLTIALLALVAAYFYQARRLDPSAVFSPLPDDAYIPLRYVDNLASGHGLVWNIGGPRVEGFTSTLYVLLMFALKAAGFSPLGLVPLVSTIFGVACIALALLLLQQLNPDRHVENLVGVILLGLSPQLWFWSAAGLETTLFAALLIGCVVLHVAQESGRVPAWIVGAAFGLSALARPEGLLLFGLTLALDVARLRRDRTRDLRALASMAAGFAVMFMPVFACKWTYFGYPLPNTYYAKTGAGWVQIRGGWDYLAGNLRLIVATASLPLLLSLFTFRKMATGRFFALYMVLGLFALIVLEGGDYIANARFVTPALPLLYALATIGLSEVTPHLLPANRLLLLGMLIAVAVIGFIPQSRSLGPHLPRADNTQLTYFADWDAGFSVMGKSLRSLASPDQSIAVVPVGAVGYFSRMQVFDMVGVTDAHIAHEPFDPGFAATWRPGHDKGDGLYILGKHPDFIQLVDRLTSQPLEGVDEWGKQYKSVVEIWNAPEFRRMYAFYPVQVEGKWFYNLYRLRSSGT